SRSPSIRFNSTICTSTWSRRARTRGGSRPGSTRTRPTRRKDRGGTKKIKKALFYPAAVLAVAVIVTVILLLFVIPQFESLFQGFGADLPAFTQMVMGMSRWMQAHGWILLIFAVVGGFAFAYFYKRSRA